MRKELLATLVIMTASSSLNAFMMDVGRMSNDDVLAGADSISFITLAKVKVENVSSVPPTMLGMLVGEREADKRKADNRNQSAIVSKIFVNLLAK